MEILQMALLQPSFCILDETDSGLDIDALRIVADGVNALRSPDRAFLVITHYQRLLNHIVPDTVHVMSAGRIVKSGGKELALELEANGYADYRERRPRAYMADSHPHEDAGGNRAGRRLFEAAKAHACRAIADARATGFRALHRGGPAAPPRRGLQVYRPARA